MHFNLGDFPHGWFSKQIQLKKNVQLQHLILNFYLLPLGFVFFATIACARWLRRLAGVYASPPAFVLFNILFLWGVYIFVIRQGKLLLPIDISLIIKFDAIFSVVHANW
jgi:hypothetical protein